MRAIRVEAFGGPEVLRVGTAADPILGPGQVLIRVRAAGINPVETYIRAGHYAALPQLPYTPGTDAAGVMEGLARKRKICGWASASTPAVRSAARMRN